MSLKQILIFGRVQGVGFRHFTLVRAKDCGLSGWVRNLKDGRVEVLVKGRQEVIERFIGELKQGPSLAQVSEIKVLEIENQECQEGKDQKYRGQRRLEFEKDSDFKLIEDSEKPWS